MNQRSLLLDIFNAALSAVDPCQSVAKALSLTDNTVHAGGAMYDLNAFRRVILIGAGKAAATMARGVEDILGNSLDRGLVIVKYGHTGTLRLVEQIEAGHPIPDAAGRAGTERILDMARNADERTLVICLLSGGGSALLVAPLPGIALNDKQLTTELLLKAGANIHELNAVRKHLSAVKGGRLARTAFPATVLTLILSDVIGDRIDVIASGPTVPDTSTFSDVARVVDKYGLWTKLPSQVAAFFERGIAGQEEETAKSGEACFLKTRNVIVGGIVQALAAARERATVLDCATEIVSADIQGEACNAAHSLARTACKVRDSLRAGERRCLLFGGETTVTVRGTGKGGRNQELALAFAREIAGTKGITLLSAGTDGTDGPTDAAGAVVDGNTVVRAREKGVHPEAYLVDNDSYTFFSKIDSLTGGSHHLITGPTGTNVMDLQILLIEG